MRHTVRRLGLLLAMGLPLFGCQSASRTTTVTGQVTLNDEPLNEGTITFLNVVSHAVVAGGAITQGRFSVQVPPGDYRVAIVSSRTVSPVPSRYNAATTLRAHIGPTSDELIFRLQSP